MSKSEDYASALGTIGAVVVGLAGCQSCLNHDFRIGEFPVTAFNLVTGAILGAVGGAVVGGIMGYFRDVEIREQDERERLEAERAAEAAARAAALERLRSIAVEIDRALNALPVLLAEAEIALDRAEDELREGLYSPFWEAVETAATGLQSFEKKLSFIEMKRAEYRDGAAKIGRAAPPFKAGVSTLPNPADTRRRLLSLYRQAQKDPHFAMVYEQRRTSTILIAGFRSLGQAIEALSDRVTDAVNQLSASLECRLVGIEASLESVAASVNDQSAALRLQSQQSAESAEAVARQLRQDAEARKEDARLALRMLDNIQTRRRPTFGDRP